jgi:hypothetical protein
MTTQAPPVTTIEERIGRLHAKLSRTIIANPAVLDEIPNSAALILLPHDADQEFVDANIALGLDALKKGRSVYFKRLEPGEWGIEAANVNAE